MSSEFAAKLKTLQFSTKGFVTRDHKNYYDRSSVDEVWGQDSTEKMLDDTDGLGAITTIGGRSYHKDRKTNEMVPVTDKELDQVYLGGRTEEEG